MKNTFWGIRCSCYTVRNKSKYMATTPVTSSRMEYTFCSSIRNTNGTSIAFSFWCHFCVSKSVQSVRLPRSSQDRLPHDNDKKIALLHPFDVYFAQQFEMNFLCSCVVICIFASSSKFDFLLLLLLCICMIFNYFNTDTAGSVCASIAAVRAKTFGYSFFRRIPPF